ncbi:MAG TPA: lysozyme inhibitor LprI family protein [Pyrinomonadaceae bacterium]|nr:lysozyme inhibitor LprI family protein [Pyrinomonadaceae bacterium]
MTRVLFPIVLLILFAGLGTGQSQKKADECNDPQSQAEMNICAGKKYQAADAKLNRTYRRLAAMLSGEQKTQLKDAQTVWLKYRDANCLFVADEYKGGSIRPLIYASCLDDVTTNRTKELEAQIEERTH